MSIMETKALDMAAVLLRAYELGDLINSSVEIADYLHWKSIMDHDQEAQARIGIFNRSKELLDECQRFGHFHPDYHQAKEQAEQAQTELEALPVIRHFKAAEQKLDDLLYTISLTIASSVSDSIKVPSNRELQGGGGCGSGGGCSGNCS